MGGHEYYAEHHADQLEEPTVTRDIRKRLEQAITEAQGKLALLDLIGDDELYADGAMIRAKVCLRSQYAAPLLRTHLLLKVVDPELGTRWFQSGHADGLNKVGGNTWAQVLQWLTTVELVSWELLAAVDRVIPPALVQTPNSGPLRRHLRYTHRNEAAMGLSDVEAEDQHTHEHHGPGGLSNHGHVPELEPAAPFDDGVTQ